MKKLKGFTLVELLVVIAIIGILSAITVVSFNGAQNAAKRVAAVSTLGDISNAVSLCIGGGFNLTATVAGDAFVCSDQTLTSVKWPASDGATPPKFVIGDFKGSLISAWTANAAGITAVPATLTQTGFKSISCTAVNSTFSCN